MPKKNENKMEEAPVPEQKNDSVVEEVGGPEGLEPTRYGDWFAKGRVSDF